MKIFPTIEKPVWGQRESWKGIENWYTTLEFTPEHPQVQEVAPACTDFQAELYLRGEAGDYTLVFPGGVHHLRLDSETARLDVSHLITEGKHLYHIQSDHLFEATVKVQGSRMLVEAVDEAYAIIWRSLPEGERQQMKGDRPAHRIGLWSRWVKLIAADSRYTTLSPETMTTLTTARFLPPLPDYPADFSSPDFADDDWQTTHLPHRWHDKPAEGYAWYRLRFKADDSWAGRQVVVRLEALTAETMIYINGHTAGYYQPGGRPLQFEISRFLRPDAENVLTLRISQNEGATFDVGSVTVAAVESYGIAFGCRLYPADEDALQLNLYAGQDTLQPVGFTPQSVILYRPPEIRCQNLWGYRQPVSINAMADEQEMGLHFQINSEGDDTLWLRLRLDLAALGTTALKVSERNSTTLEIADSAGGKPSLWLHLPGLERWILSENWDGTNLPSNASSIITTGDLLLQFKGSTTLTIAHSQPADSNYEQALTRWQKAVYQRARPLQMTDVQAAAWRSYKQTTLLNARNVPEDAAHGLLAAFDKPVFHVYWMRDCAISVPGAIYSGGEAERTALENVGPTLDRYAEIPECIGIYPDGTPREGGFSDGPALGIWAQGYAHALQGDEWLAKHYKAVEQQLAYMLERDSADGDPLDGLIRSSQGDWKDVGSMRHVWRVGAVFFVNVAYLRALRAAADMAEALGKSADAHQWRGLRDQGITLLNRSVADGGLWMPDQGYYADWVQVEGRKSWAYPQDIEDVTIFSAFSTTAHGMALAEGIIPDDRIGQIITVIEQFQLLEPLPAPSKYPFYDTLKATGHEVSVAESIALSNPWQLKEHFPDLPDWLTYDMVLPWKGWPGNHVWGGRWMMSGAWLTLGLWRAGYSELARRAQHNLAKALLRVRHPGRTEETESYSAVSREETGSYVDPAGYYQLWSGAVPLQSLIEGAYGVVPTHTGADLDLRHYLIGDGIENVPVRGGTLSCKRESETMYSVRLDTTTAGLLRLKLNAPVIDVTGGKLLADRYDGSFAVQYMPDSKLTILVKNGE